MARKTLLRKYLNTELHNCLLICRNAKDDILTVLPKALENTVRCIFTAVVRMTLAQN